jgi:hypothetical protein
MIRFQKLVDRDKNIDAMIEFAEWYYSERQTPTEAKNNPDTKQLIIGDVSGSYSANDIDDAYNKGFKDAMVEYRE